MIAKGDLMNQKERSRAKFNKTFANKAKADDYHDQLRRFKQGDAIDFDTFILRLKGPPLDRNQIAGYRFTPKQRNIHFASEEEWRKLCNLVR